MASTAASLLTILRFSSSSLRRRGPKRVSSPPSRSHRVPVAGAARTLHYRTSLSSLTTSKPQTHSAKDKKLQSLLHIALLRARTHREIVWLRFAICIYVYENVLIIILQSYNQIYKYNHMSL